MDPFDVALVISRQLADSGLVVRKLATSRAVVCASPSYLRRRGIPFRPQDLVHHECLVHRGLPTEEWSFQTNEGTVAMSGTSVLVVDDARFLREAALAGMGVAILPQMSIAEDLAEGRLLPLLDDFHSFQVSLRALHAHRELAPATVRVFVEHLVESLRRPPWDTVPAHEPATSRRRRAPSIPMTEQDVRRLSAVATVYASVDVSGASRLRGVLGRVKLLPAPEIPRSAVTMNSRVTLRDGDRDRDVSLVYPWDAGGDRVSILGRLGAALLGASTGAVVRSDERALRIAAIPYQPEAAGDHHL
jgi:hypothetical protein